MSEENWFIKLSRENSIDLKACEVEIKKDMERQLKKKE
jgi:hypothetical protein